MERKELILQICAEDKKLNLLTGRRNSYTFGCNGNSIGKVLGILSSTKGDVHPTDLCRQLGVTTPRITTILNEMESKGYIKREVAADDRRKIIVSLTKAGKDQIKKHEEKDYEFFNKVSEKLGLEDTEVLYRSMLAYEEVYRELNPDAE